LVIDFSKLDSKQFELLKDIIDEKVTDENVEFLVSKVRGSYNEI
jgi:hypothetical protein